MLILVAVSFLSLPARSSAGERPHFSRGTAEFVPGSTHFVGSGHATHLGHYVEIGCAVFSTTTDPTGVPVDGCSTYTAANGDKLHAILTGQLNAVTGAITVTVTYAGGTGRFHDASGSATLLGQILPDGTIVVTVEGTIDY
jgi:hypothetical protein